MNTGVNGVALTVLIVLFAMVAVMGVWASRWRRPTSMESLDEWGLGGRSFGTWVTWFLLGGDLYTAFRIVQKARPHRPMTKDGSQFAEEEDER